MKPQNYIDPVCGMSVSPDTHNKTTHNGKDFGFCCARCLEKFSASPAQYLEQTQFESMELSGLKTYFPLLLIFAYLLGGILLWELRLEQVDLKRMMTHFMGGFFVVFSFFKILDLKGFAGAYRTYDILARRFPFYGFVYPFVELGLGIAYFTVGSTFSVNLATSLVMGVSTLGVLQSLIQKRVISCACLGTVFKFPMSTVTLFEDLLMLVMAIMGLF